MSTKKQLQDHGFIYQDVGDVRVTARMTDKRMGKGIVRVVRDHDTLEERTTRCPASVFDGLVREYSEAP